MNKYAKAALGGVTQNPVFVLVLGMCPVLGTQDLKSALILGLATMAVLVFSNLIISALRNIIPDKVRIPCYIVIIATLVTVVDMALKHFMEPSAYMTIAKYISLIVVNCIVLGRAEAFASQNPPLASLIDGVSMGVGFTVALSLFGFLRELLGAGKIFGATVIPNFGIGLFQTSAGAFILLGILMGVFNLVYQTVMDKKKHKMLALQKALAANKEVA